MNDVRNRHYLYTNDEGTDIYRKPYNREPPRCCMKSEFTQRASNVVKQRLNLANEETAAIFVSHILNNSDNDVMISSLMDYGVSPITFSRKNTITDLLFDRNPDGKFTAFKFLTFCECSYEGCNLVHRNDCGRCYPFGPHRWKLPPCDASCDKYSSNSPYWKVLYESERDRFQAGLQRLSEINKRHSDRRPVAESTQTSAKGEKNIPVASKPKETESVKVVAEPVKVGKATNDHNRNIIKIVVGTVGVDSSTTRKRTVMLNKRSAQVRIKNSFVSQPSNVQIQEKKGLTLRRIVQKMSLSTKRKNGGVTERKDSHNRRRSDCATAESSHNATNGSRFGTKDGRGKTHRPHKEKKSASSKDTHKLQQKPITSNFCSTRKCQFKTEKGRMEEACSVVAMARQGRPANLSVLLQNRSSLKPSMVSYIYQKFGSVKK